MRFHAEHRFDAPPAAVAALLTDVDFYRSLALPDLSAPTVVEHRDDHGSALLVLRYEFVGSLDPRARRLLGHNQLTWIQRMEVDTASGTGTLVFNAEAHPRALHGRVDFTLVADGSGTLRRLDGELSVAVPLIGSMAERRIVPGLTRRLDIEAEALQKALAA